ncbi:hypothetical protein BH23ACT11_BH23ACT11_24740 [soil metagenome]
MTATKIAPLLFLILVVASCKVSGESQGATARERYEPTEQIIVTRDDPSLPDGGRPREVAGLIINFFEAFNDGDQESLSLLRSRRVG